MSTTTRTFAVAGGIGGSGPVSASIGHLIVKELLKYPDIHVHVLARSSSANSVAAKNLQSAGVNVITVDYADQASLVKALKDTEVLISTIPIPPGQESQRALVDAVATGQTGVKLFVPSEYGNDTTRAGEDSVVYEKTKFHALLREKGTPYAVFVNGPFPDLLLGALVGPDKDGEIHIVGTGDEPISFTAVTDVARYVAHILATRPSSSLADEVFRIQGSTATFNHLASLYQAKSSSPLTIVHESPSEAFERAKKGDFVAGLKAEWATGAGLVGEPVRNDEWKEWNPRDVKEFV